MKLVGTILATLLLTSACDAGSYPMETAAYNYGAADRQTLDLFRPARGKPAPLILFIHGGGWSAGSKEHGEGGQPAYYVARGYAWAAMNYRLVPSVGVEEQAADVAHAIRWLDRHAHELRLDTRHIILMGHSSGAHLAALIATDPQWLAAAGQSFTAIAGVVSLDGAGIDVPGIMAAGASSSHFYADAFGQDGARQTRLSPLAHVGAPDAPHWLFLYDQTNNQAAGFFAERFAAVARKAGAKVQVRAVADTTHIKMLGDLGKPGDAATAAVDAFVNSVAPIPKRASGAQ